MTPGTLSAWEAAGSQGRLLPPLLAAQEMNSEGGSWTQRSSEGEATPFFVEHGNRDPRGENDWAKGTGELVQNWKDHSTLPPFPRFNNGIRL